MRLKSLELQGYKTFAGKTTFAFADSITAIVGPNGSGKSNIADSIRWVLGEQSYSLLRGKKTVDMIFSGSDQRARAGMASASILFDNESGWLPIDFSEVSITRRAYRDGQNEYLINGQKVRLRDVHEMLGRSGLSERTYTIIGQGLVDAALALKAEERRRLFEEAAGIGIYRSRREEAKRRLEKTKRNLERVGDILSELKPRLRSLERQANRANQYNQLKTDLQVLLREWYGFHWYSAQQEVYEAREAAQMDENSLRRSRKEQESFENQLSEYRQQTTSLRAQLGSWLRQLSNFHSEREEITRGLVESDDQSRSKLIKRENAIAEQARLVQLRSNLNDRVSSTERNAEELQVLLNEAESQTQKAVDAFKANQLIIDSKNSELGKERENLTVLETTISGIDLQEKEKNNRIKQNIDLISSLETGISELSTQVEKTKSEAEKSTRELSQIRESQANLEKDSEKQTTQFQDLESNYNEALESLSRLKASSASMVAHMEILDQADRQLVGYAEGAKMLLKSASDGSLGGLKGALSSNLSVPEELEDAISSVLGEYLDAVIIERGGKVENALDRLNNQKVRGALLPLSDLAPKNPVQIPSEARDVIGIAADLVEVSLELRPVVDLLLGDVIVVKDRNAAMKIIRKQSNQARVVTLKGEIFHSTGQIISGTQGAGTTISRPRKKKALSEQINRVQDEIKTQNDSLEKLKDQLQSKREIIRDTERKIREFQSKEAVIASSQRKVLSDLEDLNRQVEWKSQQKTALSQEIEKLEEDIKSGKLTVDELSLAIEQKGDLIKELEREYREIQVEDHREQASYWRTELALAKKSVEDATQQLAENQRQLAETESRITTVQELIKSYESSDTDIVEKKSILRDKESELIEQINSLQELIQKTEGELSEVEKMHDALQRNEFAARQQLNALERKNAQAQLNISRSQQKLETMRERIEDDFGLVDFEYTEQTSGPTPLPFSGLVHQLPMVQELPEGLGDTIKKQRMQLRRLGAINPEAQDEYKEVKDRFEFLTSQIEDLNEAEKGILGVIAELDEIMETEFRKTFDAVAIEFKEIFTRLFGGGSARLVLTNPEDITNTGIDIEARLPGRRTQGLSLLSGGERSLTATSLVFSLLKVSPTPFCVLDEVDAMLDEANVGRFRELLRELSENTQFIIITHNRNTVQAADIIYGVTMGRDTASQIISLKLDEVADVVG